MISNITVENLVRVDEQMCKNKDLVDLVIYNGVATSRANFFTVSTYSPFPCLDGTLFNFQILKEVEGRRKSEINCLQILPDLQCFHHKWVYDLDGGEELRPSGEYQCGEVEEVMVCGPIGSLNGERITHEEFIKRLHELSLEVEKEFHDDPFDLIEADQKWFEKILSELCNEDYEESVEYYNDGLGSEHNSYVHEAYGDKKKVVHGRHNHKYFINLLEKCCSIVTTNSEKIIDKLGRCP